RVIPPLLRHRRRLRREVEDERRLHEFGLPPRLEDRRRDASGALALLHFEVEGLSNVGRARAIAQVSGRDWPAESGGPLFRGGPRGGQTGVRRGERKGVGGKRGV